MVKKHRPRTLHQGNDVLPGPGCVIDAMSLIYVAPVPWDPRSVTIIMAANPCPVMGIGSRGIIGACWRSVVVRPAGRTKRGSHNSCRSSDNGPCNRQREEKGVAVIAILGARIGGRNSEEKGKSYTRCNYDLSCIHFCLLMCQCQCRFSFLTGH
jgi:hypothetical protein